MPPPLSEVAWQSTTTQLISSAYVAGLNTAASPSPPPDAAEHAITPVCRIVRFPWFPHITPPPNSFAVQSIMLLCEE
eukprot:7382167-Prymnesium_polylepis.7